MGGGEGRSVVGVGCGGVGRGASSPRWAKRNAPTELGYLFLVSRLGEVSPFCAGLGWLQVWLGCLWGHLRKQSRLGHRWWLAWLAGLLRSRSG